MLLRHGYELRPRFRPGWTPSLAGTKKFPLLCEDGYANQHPKTINARRISDGKGVKAKKLLKNSEELDIARFFSSEDLRKDPRNHRVPVLDVFSEEDSHLEYMVMPLLISYIKPLSSSADEVLDYMAQLLEGLVFMREHGVAHRDCSRQNIMMYADPIYPKGFHPSMPALDAKGKMSSPRRRHDASGVKYYFTDLGISSRFDGAEETRLVTGEDGLDQNAPRLHERDSCDPFPVDAFILGNVFRREFILKFENVQFLCPLIDSMMQRNGNPRDRPSTEEALALIKEIVQEQTPRSLRWALIYHDRTKYERFFWTTESLIHEAVNMIKSFLSLPKRKRT